MCGESNVDLFKEFWFFLKEVLLNRTCGDCHKTKTVKNRHIKSAHLRHIGVDVQRVSVIAESVNGSLILRGGFLSNQIWLTLGNLWEDVLHFSFISESAYAANK